MNKILFLDDNKNRHNTMIQFTLFDPAFTHLEAISLLNQKKYDIVFLDHDLGGKEMVASSEEDTGMTVAKFIVQWEIPIPLIIIHSLNPAGSRNMFELLTKAGYNVRLIPFTYLPSVIKDILK